MITANLLDDMRVHLLFNRLGRNAQGVLDGERRARAVRDDANTVHSEKRAPAVLLVIRFSSNAAEWFPCQNRGQLSDGRALEFVLEPLKNRHRDRFARFQNHVADKTVAHHYLHWVLEKMTAFDVADKIERALL